MTQNTIETAWAALQQGNWQPDDATLQAIEQAVAALDAGQLRATEEWARKAILLYFRTRQASLADGGFDKIPLKVSGWSEADFKAAGFRMVPGATVRYGAFVAPNCVLMPCFINIGAHVGEGTMVDTWASVGSCAQVGRHVHLSGGAGIGGVLEPLQAKPVIIGDNAFIGARSEIVEGVEVGEGAVIAMGTFISGSTKIVDRATGAVTYGKVPPYAVVVPGSLPDAKGGPSLSCAVIVKTVDEKTRAKTGVNDLLRAA